MLSNGVLSARLFNLIYG
ncbi:protein YchT [Escherichia coli]|nr:protein YchT [Escherichia coli]